MDRLGIDPRRPAYAVSKGYADAPACHQANPPIRHPHDRYCPDASAPRVRGSGAPSNQPGVTAIELAEVCPIGSITRSPLARSSASAASSKPRSIRTSSGSH